MRGGSYFGLRPLIPPSTAPIKGPEGADAVVGPAQFSILTVLQKRYDSSVRAMLNRKCAEQTEIDIQRLYTVARKIKDSHISGTVQQPSSTLTPKDKQRNAHAVKSKGK